jgi:hypothetical protein
LHSSTSSFLAGTAVALRAKAFGLNVMYYDPFIEFGRAKALGVSQVWWFNSICLSVLIFSSNKKGIHFGRANIQL